MSRVVRADLEWMLIWSAIRMTLQLLLIGLVLNVLFATDEIYWVLLMAFMMLMLAGREVYARQQRVLKGIWGYGLGTVAMSLSTFVVTLFTLLMVISPEPWYQPQYLIPLLGMILGNAMNGVSLGIDRLNSIAWDKRLQIEARLLLGHSVCDVMRPVRRESIRVGMIPIINAMAAAGIVSLPGMMTGQILAGTPPMQAVAYQIVIMFMIAAGTGIGSLIAVMIGSRQLFDQRDRLRLDRLTLRKKGVLR